jgi:hypothetical protein
MVHIHALQTLPAQFPSVVECFEAMLSEMLFLNCGGKFRIDVITPEAPTDDLTRIRVGASALAMQRNHGSPQVSRKLDLHHSFGQCLFCRVFFWAISNLNGAIAVVVAIHRQVADAYTVLMALIHSLPALRGVMNKWEMQSEVTRLSSQTCMSNTCWRKTSVTGRT